MDNNSLLDEETQTVSEEVDSLQENDVKPEENSKEDTSDRKSDMKEDNKTSDSATSDGEVSHDSHTSADESSDKSVDQKDVSTSQEDAGQKAVDEFKKSLRTLPGEWYVLHTYSGYEKRVKQNLQARIANFGLEDIIFQIEVPMEEVEQHTDKGRKVINRVRIPGYVLIRMLPDDDAFRIVRETEAVTGFVGTVRQPVPLGPDEVVRMMAPMISQKALKEAGEGHKARKNRVVEVAFKQGDAVTVIDGPFTSMQGVISEVNPTTQKLTVLVSIFDRDTPMELSFDQVEKIDQQ